MDRQLAITLKGLEGTQASRNRRGNTAGGLPTASPLPPLLEVTAGDEGVV